MNEISAIEKYRLFEKTICECGMFLLDLKDEEIEYNIFEEFDGDRISFLNEELLGELLLGKYIDKQIYAMSAVLKILADDLESNHQELWNVESVRISPKWRLIMLLCDEIKDRLICKSI